MQKAPLNFLVTMASMFATIGTRGIALPKLFTYLLPFLGYSDQELWAMGVEEDSTAGSPACDVCPGALNSPEEKQAAHLPQDALVKR